MNVEEIRKWHRIFKRDVGLCDGLTERVEIDDDHVDGRDVQFRELRHVLGIAAHGQ